MKEYPQAIKNYARGRYVVPRTPELEAQVDTVMSGFGFESYAEMFRVLIRDAYDHLRRDKTPHYSALVPQSTGAPYVSLTRHDIELALDELVLDAEPNKTTETPSPEELLAQINATIAASGLKYVLVDEPTPDTARLRPWFLNKETHLYEQSDLDIPVILRLLESEPVQKS